MTRASLREYAAVQRERYQHATRAEKHQLLDELVTVTGMHRKAAIRLLRRAPRPPTGPSRAGRPRSYGPDVAAAAEVLWQASGRIGAHRLHPFVGELLERLIRCGELTVAPGWPPSTPSATCGTRPACSDNRRSTAGDPLV